MNHFCHDHCSVPILKNLHIVIVQTGSKRWSRVEADKAAGRESTVLRAIFGDAADGVSNRSGTGHIRAQAAKLSWRPFDCRRKASILRIHHQGSSNRVADTGDFEPEIVVTTWIVTGFRRIGIHHQPRSRGIGGSRRGLLPFYGFLNLFLGQKFLIAVAGRSLHRRVGAEIPDALQVRLTIFGSRNHIVSV